MDGTAAVQRERDASYRGVAARCEARGEDLLGQSASPCRGRHGPRPPEIRSDGTPLRTATATPTTGGAAAASVAVGSPGEHRNYRDAGKGGGKGGGMPCRRARRRRRRLAVAAARRPPGRPMGSGKGGGGKGGGGGGKGGGRGGGGLGDSFAQQGSLNARLSAARSCDDMLLLHAQMQSSMDIRHLGLLWPKLGKRVALECGKGRAAVKQWTRAHSGPRRADCADRCARPAPFARAGALDPNPRARRPPSPRPPAARAPPPQRSTSTTVRRATSLGCCSAARTSASPRKRRAPSGAASSTLSR